MSDEALLTICIPTYNRADILRETLADLEREIDPTWEVVVSDDASPDHTREVLEEFDARSDRFRTIVLSENIGSIRNTDFVNRLARTKYIYTLSDDDQLVAPGIRRALALLESNPTLVGVFGNYQEWIRATGSTADIRTFHEEKIHAKGTQLEVLQQYNLIWDPVMRREFFERHCQFDHHMFQFWPLVDRMLRHGDLGVVTDIFFKHATNQPVATMEGQLTEGWYHDAYRAGYEYYIGAQFPGVMDNAVFIAQSLGHSLKHAVRFSINKREFLKARNFLLRARAYGAMKEDEIAANEKLHMQNFIAEKIRDSLSIYDGIAGVVLEDLPEMMTFAKTLQEHVGDLGVSFHSVESLAALENVSDHYVIMRDYDALKRLEDMLPPKAVKGTALQDLFDTFRISDWPMDQMFAQQGS